MATTLIGSVTSALVTGAPWALRTRLFGGLVGGDTITTTIRGGEAEVPWQDGANGDVGWISGYLATPFTLAGTVTIGARARESATSVNIGLRARVWKIPASVEDAAVLIGTFDRSGEIATSLTAAYTWTGTPTSTVCKINDRLLLRGFFYPQGGTIGAGTGDIRDQSNELFLQLTEDVTFSDAPILNPIRSIPILGQPRPLF